ncbi:hypothetical protein BDY19DRAFT_911158 [Irpex rosettiformis]|uniref:Uncharacterized protein n=1 Tax=Irpex rosettiformis TaxID=378272 RepID=A0ACB8UID3_9APHY|nr:hypothetical protein BDY19DRAFT_911158 [Irpex rosettiformis]
MGPEEGNIAAVVVPYIADYLGAPFTDSASFWEANCAASSATNGVDLKSSSSSVTELTQQLTKRLPHASIIDIANSNALGFLSPFLPTLPPQPGSTGIIKSFILPGKETGVMFVGSFEGDSVQFRTDTDSAVRMFLDAGVERYKDREPRILIVEPSNPPSAGNRSGGYRVGA